VDVHLWDSKNWVFTNSTALVMDPYITNIAAGDFNYDGKLDLMVSGINVNSTNNSTYLLFILFNHFNLYILTQN
jgi:hypothetical protein